MAEARRSTTMNEANIISRAISDLVVATANQIHREEYFTTMLFGSLWQAFGVRMLGTTGLGLTTLQPVIKGTHADSLRAQHLPKTKDYYVDLLITTPLDGRRITSTLRIDDVLLDRNVTHLYEFKYFTSFQTMSRHHAREDGYKLKVLGEYVRISSGLLPHMEQFIVLSKRPCKAKPKTVASVSRWFDDIAYRSDTQGVIKSIVDVDGSIYQQ